MDIKFPLNPEGGSQVLTETSDQEIYHIVMDSIKAHENIDGDGDDQETTVLTMTSLMTLVQFVRFSRQYQPSASA